MQERALFLEKLLRAIHTRDDRSLSKLVAQVVPLVGKYGTFCGVELQQANKLIVEVRVELETIDSLIAVVKDLQAVDLSQRELKSYLPIVHSATARAHPLLDKLSVASGDSQMSVLVVQGVTAMLALKTDFLASDWVGMSSNGQMVKAALKGITDLSSTNSSSPPFDDRFKVLSPMLDQDLVFVKEGIDSHVSLPIMRHLLERVEGISIESSASELGEKLSLLRRGLDDLT